jgi:serine O-acetyltransferase
MSEQDQRPAAEDVSADFPDWTREKPTRFWDPSRKLIMTIRRYQYWRTRRGIIATFAHKLLIFRHRFWSVVTGADIALNSNIGGGLLLPHPNGVVIHPRAIIGVNCYILQQVTIGELPHRDGVAVIEGHVDIGAGAKILGPVRIGAHAIIGPNSVVLSNVESKTSVIGIPAKRFWAFL